MSYMVALTFPDSEASREDAVWVAETLARQFTHAGVEVVRLDGRWDDAVLVQVVQRLGGPS